MLTDCIKNINMAKLTKFFKGEKMTPMQSAIIDELMRSHGCSATFNLSPSLREAVRLELKREEAIMHKNDVIRQIYIEEMNDIIEKVRLSRSSRSKKADLGFYPADNVIPFHFDDID